jgi:hypothetical protein
MLRRADGNDTVEKDTLLLHDVQRKERSLLGKLALPGPRNFFQPSTGAMGSSRKLRAGRITKEDEGEKEGERNRRNKATDNISKKSGVFKTK